MYSECSYLHYKQFPLDCLTFGLRNQLKHKISRKYNLFILHESKLHATRSDSVRASSKLRRLHRPSHLIFSCSLRSSICRTSSRFSEERVHQLQTSTRQARRRPPTRRGGHLPPPTLIPSIPIALFLSLSLYLSLPRRDPFRSTALVRSLARLCLSLAERHVPDASVADRGRRRPFFLARVAAWYYVSLAQRASILLRDGCNMSRLHVTPLRVLRRAQNCGSSGEGGGEAKERGERGRVEREEVINGDCHRAIEDAPGEYSSFALGGFSAR